MSVALAQLPAAVLPPMPLRQVRAADVWALGALSNAAHRGGADDEGWSVARDVREMADTLAGAFGVFCYPASAIAGASEAAALFTIDGGVPLLAHCMTAPPARGRGVATHLICRGAEVLATAGHERLRLVVTDDNPARAIYERLGFAPDPWDRHSRAAPLH